MKIRILLWRGHYALMTFVGFRPALSPDERIVRMSLDKLQGIVDEARAAFARKLSADQTTDSQISDLTNANQALQAQVNEFEAEAIAVVQPLHDDVVNNSPAAPPPPPPPPEEPAPTDPSAEQPSDPGAPAGTGAAS